MTSDLESLRNRTMASRANPEPLDPASREQLRRHAAARAKGYTLSDLVVTRTGEIRTIQKTGKKAAGISRITAELFSGQVDEDAWAAEYLPPRHSRFAGGTASGWVYQVRTNRGDMFEFFLSRDRYQRRYLVRFIAPRLEQMGLVHATHLFADGHLCMGPGGRAAPVEQRLCQVGHVGRRHQSAARRARLALGE